MNLRTFKKNQVINIFFRVLFKQVYSINVFIARILTRWDISGKVKISIQNVDFFLFSKCDDHIVTNLYYGIEWEKSELEIWTILSKKSDIILDIGANTGVYSILSSKIQPQSTTYAFEPNPINYKRLTHNLNINNIENVTPIPKAVGNDNSTIKFTVPKSDEISLVSSAVNDFSESFFGVEYKQIETPQIKLDDFVKDMNLVNIDLIKIDVEYYEEFVLKGAIKILSEQSPVFICEVFMYDVLAGDKPNTKLVDSIPKDQAKNIQTLFKEHGYYPYSIGIRGLLRVDNILSSPDGGMNFVFSKVKSSNLYLPYNRPDEIATLLSKNKL